MQGVMLTFRLAKLQPQTTFVVINNRQPPPLKPKAPEHLKNKNPQPWAWDVKAARN